MANILEGYLNGKDLKIGIVVASFNEFITSNLLSGAIDTPRPPAPPPDDYLEQSIHFAVMKQMKMILMLLGYQVHLKFL